MPSLLRQREEDVSSSTLENGISKDVNAEEQVEQLPEDLLKNKLDNLLKDKLKSLQRNQLESELKYKSKNKQGYRCRLKLIISILFLKRKRVGRQFL